MEQVTSSPKKETETKRKKYKEVMFNLVPAVHQQPKHKPKHSSWFVQSLFLFFSLRGKKRSPIEMGFFTTVVSMADSSAKGLKLNSYLLQEWRFSLWLMAHNCSFEKLTVAVLFLPRARLKE